MMSPKKLALFTLAIAASVAVVSTTATGCKAVTSDDNGSATNKDKDASDKEQAGNGNGSDGGDGATDPTVGPTEIDPQLVGTWSLVATGAGTQTTFHDDGTFLTVVVFRGSVSDLDVAQKGNYRTADGRIYYSDAISQTSKDQGETWSDWTPSATPSWEELYVVGTDDDGEYLILEKEDIKEDSAKYRRSSE